MCVGVSVWLGWSGIRVATCNTSFCDFLHRVVAVACITCMPELNFFPCSSCLSFGNIQKSQWARSRLQGGCFAGVPRMPANSDIHLSSMWPHILLKQTPLFPQELRSFFQISFQKAVSSVFAWHHDSVVSMITRLWAGQSRVRIPAGQETFLLLKLPDQV